MRKFTIFSLVFAAFAVVIGIKNYSSNPNDVEKVTINKILDKTVDWIGGKEGMQWEMQETPKNKFVEFLAFKKKDENIVFNSDLKTEFKYVITNDNGQSLEFSQRNVFLSDKKKFILKVGEKELNIERIFLKDSKNKWEENKALNSKLVTTIVDSLNVNKKISILVEERIFAKENNLVEMNFEIKNNIPEVFYEEFKKIAESNAEFIKLRDESPFKIVLLTGEL